MSEKWTIIVLPPPPLLEPVSKEPFYEVYQRDYANPNSLFGKISKIPLPEDNSSIHAKVKPFTLFRPDFEMQSSKIDIAQSTGFRPSFIKTITNSEGLRLGMYKCSADKRTIGYGHNVDADPDYPYGEAITIEQANELLEKDLLTAKKSAINLVGKARYNKLRPGQKEALVDLTFNLGEAKLEKTNFINFVKKGQLEKAVGEMNFIYAANKVNSGLCKRRLSTIALFAEGTSYKSAQKQMKSLLRTGIAACSKKQKSGFVVAVKKLYTAGMAMLTPSAKTTKGKNKKARG